ncbi:hypothetical protein PLEOSDRAFT_1069524, partial [Pleurotus ostreatus PC15]
MGAIIVVHHPSIDNHIDTNPETGMLTSDTRTINMGTTITKMGTIATDIGATINHTTIIHTGTTTIVDTMIINSDAAMVSTASTTMPMAILSLDI